MTYDLDIVRDEKDLARYFYVTYEIESSVNVYDAAFALAVGQSIGNPNARSNYETTTIIEDHCCKIIRNSSFEKKKGLVEVGFPLANIDLSTDGISQLLCMIMGGQTDIDIIKKCRAIGIEFDQRIADANFSKPRWGIIGMREYTSCFGKPLLGGIIKPKTGITPDELLSMTKELVEGGVNFIKEDEILGNPNICRLQDRVEKISTYIQGRGVVYAFCINSDPAYVVERARFVAQNGGNGVHVNIWSGLGVYKSIRDANLDLFIHYQKSGDKVITHPKNAFGISWQVLCQLAVYCGVDTIHSGMWGGYLSDTEEDLRATFKVLHEGNVVPALSCGMTAELIAPIVSKFGIDWMANVGGAIHSDPNGTTAGAKKIRRAIDNLGVY
jgi:ribulose-bisphosphate carboxylase large chain